MRVGVTSLCGILALSAAELPLEAQQVRTLGKPDAEYAEPFTSIVGVRELKDGRVIVADGRERTLQLVDFKNGTATPIGRTGQGPGEYQSVGRLLALGGDSTVMYDGPNGRLLLLGPDGKPAGDFRAERAGGVASAVSSSSVFIGGLRGSDARGRIYYQPFSMTPAAVDPRPADSAAIVRYDRAAKTFDTIAFVRVSKTDVASGRGTGPEGQRVIGFRSAEIPFAMHDDWAALPDGRVAVVRGADYHVDYYTSAKAKSAGAPTKYERLPVTDADKEEVREARRPRIPPGGRAPIVPPILEPSEWPAFKSPFLESSAWARPNGELWVSLSRKAGDKAPRFDVFDGKGKRLGTAVLPSGDRLIGFGTGTVYTIRTDADDLQYLQRYTLKEGPVLP